MLGWAHEPPRSFCNATAARCGDHPCASSRRPETPERFGGRQSLSRLPIQFWRPYGALFGGGLPSENHVHSGENKLQFRLGQLAHSHSQLALVESHNLRDVRHRFLGKSGRALTKKNVTWRRRPLHVARQGNTDRSRDSTPVQSITLYDQYRSAKSWLRSARFTKIRPPHLSLRDRHHSLRSSVRRAARDTNPSAGSFTSSRTRFIASVTLSGAWRATYSLSAREYTSLRDRFARCARVSARSKMSFGMETAVFIPTV